MKSKGFNFARLALLAIGTALFILGLLPVVIFWVKNIGVYILLLSGALLIAFSFFYNVIMKNLKKRIFLFRMLTFFLTTCLASIFFISILMLRAAVFLPPNNDNESECTVIVLGCQVRGTVPSLMLQRRIDAAGRYLLDNPSAVCVASGGQGPGENITEAEAIKRRLLQMGISDERIYIENRSTSTETNMEYSYNLIKETNLPETVVVATDNFHQQRARLLLSRFISPKSISHISSLGPVSLLPAYWVREIGGVVLALLST